MAHNHPIEEQDWPFDTPINTMTFTTVNIVDGSSPIIEVYHDHEGDWQFMCGTTARSEDCKIVCLGCMLGRDISLAELHDLPEGWMAYRASNDSPWIRQPYERESNPDEV